MSSVSYLNISHNEISSLEDFKYSQFFLSSKDKPRLTLDVRDNHIQTIPDWLFTMEFTTELFISGNPIQCSCIKAHQYRAFLEVRDGVDISSSVWGHHVGGSQCRGVPGDRGLSCCHQLPPPPQPHHCGGDSRPGGSWYHWIIFSSLDQISPARRHVLQRLEGLQDDQKTSPAGQLCPHLGTRLPLQPHGLREEKIENQ